MGLTVRVHVDRRERLRGTEVTRGADVTWIAYLYLHYIFISIRYKSSDYRKTSLLNPLLSRRLYTCLFLLFFLVWD